MFSPPDYSSPQSFLDPKLGPWTVPLYLHRKPILDSVREASPVLKGKLLDVGCGNKPYANLLSCSTHVGLDITSSPHCKSNFDATYDGTVFPFPDEEYDSILCTEVLEHSRQPSLTVSEIARVLRPGGHALIAAPMVIHHHEEPYDFQRFTRYGMVQLAEEAGLEVVYITARGGAYATALSMMYVAASQTISARPFSDVLMWLLWPFALAVLRLDKIRNRTCISLGWQMLARKPESTG
jgi:SAM-dependent methyltransferase